jgi:asparagine synthetase B (glutamine-hydrolysing)
MPGINGKIKYRGDDVAALVTNQGDVVSKLDETNVEGYGYHLKAAKNTRNSSSYKKDNIYLIYEGVFIDGPNSNEDTAKDLHQRYIKHGDHFVQELRGSFQIVIVDERKINSKILVYSDPVASRPFFYATDETHIFVSPDVESIIQHVKEKTIDEMAMINFLIAGHFPAGHTAISEIKILGPGQYLYIHNNKLKIRKYFNFKIDPGAVYDEYELKKLLKETLTNLIIKYWKSSDDQAILLSGGYDSQFIFYTIAKWVEDTSKLVTVTWGQRPEKRYADMEVARRTAKRFGTQHIQIEKNLDNWKSEYDEMFIAQSGMTDSSFYHANELTVCKNLFNKWGIRSIIRGDECFGYGPSVNSVQGALKANSMSYPQHLHQMNNWFKDENKFVDKFELFMDQQVDQYACNTHDCLKDTLDFYERQHMNRNPLNYYKLHYLDVACPLIDIDLLKIICKLPDKFRHHKKLFKTVVDENFSNQLQIAQFTNLTNWENVISDTREIKIFFEKELKNLPNFLNRDFFKEATKAIVKRNNHKIRELMQPLKRVRFFNHIFNSLNANYGDTDNKLDIPIHFLVIRAVVLARWNKLWIKCDI